MFKMLGFLGSPVLAVLSMWNVFGISDSGARRSTSPRSKRPSSVVSALALCLLNASWVSHAYAQSSQPGYPAQGYVKDRKICFYAPGTWGVLARKRLWQSPCENL